jgi:hypothetical protein
LSLFGTYMALQDRKSQKMHVQACPLTGDHVISSDAYMSTVRDRLIADGCKITYETVGPVQALVGYRSDIKALSKMHLFTVVASVPEVNEATLRDFAHRVSDYAKAQKGALRGMQSGVLAFAVLVAPKVDNPAKEVAAQPAP